ncbi:MAG TPA: hypothetical protein VM307_09135 [Egibacteraceae bacterium]|nr:hypothetical protein [Egibacteraceae bacterium]
MFDTWRGVGGFAVRLSSVARHDPEPLDSQVALGVSVPGRLVRGRQRLDLSQRALERGQELVASNDQRNTSAS